MGLETQRTGDGTEATPVDGLPDSWHNQRKREQDDEIGKGYGGDGMGLIKGLMKKAAWRLFDIRERRPDPAYAGTGDDPATDGEDGRTCDEETLRKVKGYIDEIEAFSERTHGELLPKGDGTPPDGNGFPDEGEMTDEEATTLLVAVTDAQRDAPTGEDDDIDEVARKARLAEEAIEALPPIWEADDEAYLGDSKE